MLPRNFRACATVRLENQREVGIVFNYVDKDNFCYARLHPGARMAFLFSRVSGTDLPIANTLRPIAISKDINLTLDRIGAQVRFYIDGMLALERILEQPASGRLGLLCTNQTRVRFLQFKVSAPVWQNFAAFGVTPQLQPGTKITVLNSSPAAGVPPAIEGTVLYAAAFEDSGRLCFPGQPENIRLLGPGSEVVHARQFRAAGDYIDVAVKVLRKADGTGILLFPQPPGNTGIVAEALSPGDPTPPPAFSSGLCRLRLTFYRNRQQFDLSGGPKSFVWSQAGDDRPERVEVDIPI